MDDHEKTKEQLIAELRALRERYRDLFQEAPVMYVMTRDAGGFPIVDDCNRLFLTTLGFELDEVVGRPLGDFYTPDSRAELTHGGGYESALSGTFVARERGLVTKSGEVVETLLRAVPVGDREGKTTGTRAMFVDITENKRAEEELRRSEEKFRSLFEESQDVIFFSTPEGRLLDVNPAGVELFGFKSKDDLLDVDVAKDLYWNPEDREEIMRRLAEDGRVKDFELKLKRRDGTRILVLETTTAVRNEAGELVACRGILRDVSGERELQEQLRRSQRMEAIGRLAGGVAHDFNNLLTAILGFAELGTRKCGPDKAQRGILNEITKASLRAAELTRQLLAFARRQVLQPKVMDLNAVIRNLDGLLRRTLGDEITLVMKLDPELGPVKADPGQIEQILVNLTVNARDAMFGGEHARGELRFETTNADLPRRRIGDKVTMEAGPYVVLAVSDTGGGMDEDTRNRVFEPFFTTKAPGEGTGLGLSTVYGIVKQSGGYIWVESEPDRGTVFEIFLPRVDESVEPTRAREPPDQLAGGSETVLVVEDDEVVRGLTERILSSLGYRVFAVPGAEEARKISVEHRGSIDLLLTDVELKGMNGLELARQVVGCRPETKVLAMSGHAKEAALRANPLDSNVSFLAKPFGPRSLAGKVREVLDNEEAGS